mgnify:CR=1 FL=1
MTFLTVNRRARNFDDLFLDNIFDNFFSPASSSYSQEGYAPSLDVQSNDDVVNIVAELPGLDKKDINIEYKDKVLTISGEKIIEREEKSQFYTERRSGKFSRSLEVGGIDFKKSNARYENGVLTVNLPKSEQEKAKYLSVS